MSGGAKKPAWVIDKERAKRAAASETVWLFGLHAVRDALLNPARQKLRLVLTKNAFDKLEDAVSQAGIEPEIVDPRKFSVPIDEGSVHQGAALEVKPLNWGKLADVAISGAGAPLVVLLDRVTDPHNVGAVLRSAEVFGARAVIAPRHHSAPETGALAKTASGALERQPYLRVTNLSEAMEQLKDMGFFLIGLDGAAPLPLAEAVAAAGTRPIGLVMGAEGPGLRVVAVDYGAKRNILRCLASAGCEVTVLPATATAEEVLAHNPEGVFLSNGPGDPAATGSYAVPMIQEVLKRDLPVFGICLGHQMLALALGAQTVKMSHGHHGANHPVKEVGTGKVEITSMNHGFTVDAQTLPAGVEETHISLFDGTNCGIAVKGKPVFSVQHHPEASPGPQDSFYLFERFAEAMRARRSA